MKYPEFRYLYPPRPNKAISKAFVGHYENLGYLAQIKLNGTCSVLGVSPDRQSIRAMTRHNDEHKAWSPNKNTLPAFQNLPGNGWYVFVAELLHSKGNFRNINYIHDILVADGVFLCGENTQERQDILQNLFKTTDDGSISHTVIDDHTWLVKNYRKDFLNLFDSLTEEHYEGLVMKDPKARLKLCDKEHSNSESQVKIRKPNKNYSY
jgi:hypothetical protein